MRNIIKRVITRENEKFNFSFEINDAKCLPKAKANPFTTDDFPDPFGPMITFRVGPGLNSTSEYCMKSLKYRRTMLPCWNPHFLFWLSPAIISFSIC